MMTKMEETSNKIEYGVIITAADGLHHLVVKMEGEDALRVFTGILEHVSKKDKPEQPVA